MEESLSLLDKIKKTFDCDNVDVRMYSPLTLAFMGDCVFEIVIRSIVVERGNRQAGSLHKIKSSVVNAKVQARMIEALMEELTEEEEAMKWSEFEKSEEYALLKRLTRRAKADSASTDGFTVDLEKAIAAGITTGDYPQDVATREQVASMIVRAHNL